MGGWILIVLVMAAVVVADLVHVLYRPRPPARTITRRRAIDEWTIAYSPTGPKRDHGDEPRGYWCDHWAAFMRHEPTTAAQRDEMAIDVAFQLEFRARRMFAGEQFKGILRGRHTVVWGRHAGVKIRALLSAHQPGPEARAHVDRALAWWSAALELGMGVYEWDEDGYDGVTEAFLGFEKYAATKPAIDTAAHGVRVETWEEVYQDRRPPLDGLRLVRALFLGGTIILLWSITGGARRSSEPPPRENCAERRATVLEKAERVRQESKDPRQLAVLPRVVAAIEAGDTAEARALWEPVKQASDEDYTGMLFGTELFLLEMCRP